MRLTALALVLLAGCSTTPPLVLGPEFAPLARVAEIEVGGVALVAPGVTTTIGDTSWVGDLAAWEADYSLDGPDRGVRREAVLRHEATHARRQLGTGAEGGYVAGWLARYAVDPSFRWVEEQAGWREEILALYRGGVYVDVEATAGILSGPIYTVLGSPMTTLDEARAFVRAVIGG